MQLLAHALIVASVATAILIARSAVEVHTAPSPPIAAPAPAVATTPAPAIYATVVKPFGASIRVAPSLEAAGLYNVSCGAVLPALAIERGWVKVQTEVGVGWIGASRVAVGNGPAATGCSSHRFLYPTADARASVSSGCLRLQPRPSLDDADLACVGNGHVFSVVDGPVDPGTGEDWFKVSSPTTGTGWVPAEHLYPR
jgi:hypothetical protein